MDCHKNGLFVKFDHTTSNVPCEVFQCWMLEWASFERASSDHRSMPLACISTDSQCQMEPNINNNCQIIFYYTHTYLTHTDSHINKHKPRLQFSGSRNCNCCIFKQHWQVIFILSCFCHKNQLATFIIHRKQSGSQWLHRTSPREV